MTEDSALPEYIIQHDGGLYDPALYLHWDPQYNTATLEGNFTAAELRAIADHMDKHKAP